MAAQWIRRRGSKGSGFSYADAGGRIMRSRRLLGRVDTLHVPPAWRDVHIATSSTAAVQAWGVDARGRKQYRYHDRAVTRRELRKYHRVRQLAKELPRLRRLMREASAASSPTRTAVAAIVLRLITETYCRVGGERYLRENGTYGITTLEKSHVARDHGVVTLSYRGKSKVQQRQVVSTPELIRMVSRMRRTPGVRLFRYRNATGWHDLTAQDVTTYLRHQLGRYTAKDFRTWGGTLRAATVLAELGAARSATEAKRNVTLAMRLVAAELGNTATVCRQSYVHPIVIARYLDEGETIPLSPRRRGAADRGQAHSPEERALIVFLDQHFPDRRKAPR
jgi:DNA topoisomerase I